MKPQDFIMMPIPAESYTAVCALLGGASAASGNGQASGVASPGIASGTATNETGMQESPASAGTGATATTGASPSDGEVDAGGHPWSADLHASTKGKTKEGFWRMKVGVTRPDPLPGSPATAATDTGTSTATDTASATSQTAPAPAPAPAAGEDDEFAAFRTAAAASDATDAAAAASAPARTYTDADLGALCNQAATKLGDPSPIKEIIANYVPEGQVAHSRNVPDASRAAFVADVEAKAGIEFAG